MTTKANLTKKLRKSKEYRSAFVDAEISVGIPFQIRALREKRGWSQQDLAEAATLMQPRICAMEQAGYGSFTLSTLKKLAAAFDVGLVVRFASFGEMAEWADKFSPDTFEVPTALEDPQLIKASSAALVSNSEIPVAISAQTASITLSSLMRDGMSTSVHTSQSAALSAAHQVTSNTANSDQYRLAA